MDQNETQTSNIRKLANDVNAAVVLGALAYSAYTLGRLAFAGAREGVRVLKDRKNRQIEN